MVPEHFIPPNPDGQNDDRSAWVQHALHEYARVRPGSAEPRIMLAALLADLMHWCDREGVSFDQHLRLARGTYARDTDGVGSAGAAYAWLCRWVASQCGYQRSTPNSPVRAVEDTDVAGAQSWPDWEICCRENGINVDAPDPYEIAARASGWTNAREDEKRGAGICRRRDLDHRSGPEYVSWQACCAAQGIAPAEVPSLGIMIAYLLELDVDNLTDGTPVAQLVQHLLYIANRASPGSVRRMDSRPAGTLRPHLVERIDVAAVNDGVER